MRTRTGRDSALLLIVRTSLVLVPLLLLTPERASAYTDPGTGAFMYQAAYAAFLGGSFYLRKLLDRFWHKRKGNPQLGRR